LKANPLKDLTLPVVALTSSRRITRLLQSDSYVGHADIEDLSRPFFCVSANLGTARVVVHERGPAWWAIRASVSLPGVLPPVWHNGHLLVDGGILDNLPVDAMQRRLERGRIIAVDLQPERSSVLAAPFDPVVSGWRALAARLRPGAKAANGPSLPGVLLRAKDVGSERTRREVLASGGIDLHLRPPVDTPGAFDFARSVDLIEVAYRYTLAQLEAGGLELLLGGQSDIATKSSELAHVKGGGDGAMHQGTGHK